jgi:hypothetical protein
MTGVRFPVGAGNFSVLHYVQTGSGPTQPTILWVPWVERPGREADHSPPCSVEVKNAWRYTAIPTTSSWRGAWLSTGTTTLSTLSIQYTSQLTRNSNRTYFSQKLFTVLKTETWSKLQDSMWSTTFIEDVFWCRIYFTKYKERQFSDVSMLCGCAYVTRLEKNRFISEINGH